MEARTRGRDHTLLRELQVRVGDRLEKEITGRARSGKPRMSPEDEEVMKAELARQVVTEHVREVAEDLRGTMRWEDAEDLIDALKSLLYGAGSLDALLRDERIEEIVMNSWDKVFCYYTDGTKARVAPVYASNEDMIEAIQTLAAHEGLASRYFDSVNTHVNFRVTYAIDTPEGPRAGTARFQAVMGTSTAPSLTIRLHPPQRLFRLKDLVAAGTMDQQCADFLAALVRAKKNVIIAGETAAGKTVLLRAMAAEIGPEERLITIERALELGLEDDEEAHPDIVVMEERIANAEGEGAVPMRDLLMISKRMRPDRVIVGEVLGPEILVMLNAMMQGNDGSLSTIHSNTSKGVEENIVSYAIQAQERLPREGTISMIANGLDFIVFMKRYRADGEQRRVVHSIREIESYDGDTLKTNEIFKPGADGMAVRDPDVGIICLNALREVGYNDGTDPGRWA